MKAVSVLWADQIIAGNRIYTNVPAKLIDEVKQILTERGRKDLISE